MDSWVTDGFYSHFPSYSQQPTRRQALAKARQLDYQTFLSRVSPQPTKTDGKALKRQTTNQNQNKRPKVTPNDCPNDKLPKLDTNIVNDKDGDADMSSRVVNKHRFQDELERMDLPAIINEETINGRNQKLAEEKRKRNIEYQQELMAQIEQKRREREIQRAKEEAEDERLTKRMEEQLKLVRLQDELETQRQSRQREKSRINLELQKPMLSQQLAKPPTTVRSEPIIDANAQPYRPYDERQAQTDRGKENYDEIKRSDKDIYNFFTNSAQKHSSQLKDLRFSHYFDPDEQSDSEAMPNSMSSSYNTYPSKSTRYHDAVAAPQKRRDNDTQRPMCNFCKHHRFLPRNQKENLDYICGSCESEPICLNCRKEICVQCKRPTQRDERKLKVPPRHLKQRNKPQPEIIIVKDAEPQAKPKYVRLDSFRPIFTDEDDSLSDLSTSDHKPYSFNIDESSVFHPSKSRINRKLSVSIKNGEVTVEPDFDELRRITEEKFQKFAKNYGELRAPKKTSAEAKDVRVSDTRIPISVPKAKGNIDPLPAMRENTKYLIEFAKELERGDNNIFRRIEAKHQIAAVQTNRVQQNDDTTSTLTQVGAFKKQLQLDKLNF